MIQLICKPEIHLFSTCEAFVQAFSLNADDLVISNAYIYEPYFSKLGLPVKTLFLERYGSGEPTDTMVERIMADAKDIPHRRIIAIGGGTVIDVSKVLALRCAGNVDELYSAMPNLVRASELTIIPTTCGTGSEMTNLSVLNRTRLGTKMGLASPAMFADCAVLIPELLHTLPLGVFATSSIDALVHAAESSLSPKATAYTKLFGYRAMEMLIRGFQRITAENCSAESRISEAENFLLASNFAGIAFGTAGCATVHAMAYPLGGMYHVAHGESNYALFTGVLKSYLETERGGEIGRLCDRLSEWLCCKPEQTFDELEKLLDRLLPKKPLRAYGVTREDLQAFTDSVMRTQGRLLANSFVPMTAERVYEIYVRLY